MLCNVHVPYYQTSLAGNACRLKHKILKQNDATLTIRKYNIKHRIAGGVYLVGFCVLMCRFNWQT